MSFLDAVHSTLLNVAHGFDAGVNQAQGFMSFLRYEKDKLTGQYHPVSVYQPDQTIYDAGIDDTIDPMDSVYSANSGTPDLLPLLGIGLAVYLLMKA